MALYEVKFFIRTNDPLTDAEITNVAHTVNDRMAQNAKPEDRRVYVGRVKPEGRKVYVGRVYEEHEKRDLIRRHADNDQNFGRDWNSKAGCSCEVCREYREAGAVITASAVRYTRQSEDAPKDWQR